MTFDPKKDSTLEEVNRKRMALETHLVLAIQEFELGFGVEVDYIDLIRDEDNNIVFASFRVSF